MATTEFGVQELTDEDRGYAGSTFKEVVHAIFANPYQRVWGAEGEPPLPVGEVTLASLLRGGFANASARTLDSAADLRWGPDRKGFRRLVHPNGVCLTGKWRITESSDYSGYFEKGREALVIGRYSTCCTETRRGKVRSLALVGKLFPTTDPDHPTALRTANFITQEDLGGTRTEFINDLELRNGPDTTLARRGVGAATLAAIGLIFSRVDSHPSIRQLYPVAELGKPAGQPTRAPEFMRLLVARDQPRIPGAGLDFRDEVMAQIFDRGDPSPKRALTFTIEVTDEGVTSGSAVQERRTFRNWRPIGSLSFGNAVMSHNGDRVIHFSHPTWRADRNDPSTATRIDGKKVR
jgi:hypothetical protein